MRLILLGGIRLLLGAHGVAELSVRNYAVNHLPPVRIDSPFLCRITRTIYGQSFGQSSIQSAGRCHGEDSAGTVTGTSRRVVPASMYRVSA